MTYLLGTSYASDATLLSQLESPAARGVVVQAAKADTTFAATTIRWVAELSGVESLVALTPVESARNGRLGDAGLTVGFFRMWALKGPTPVVEITDGRASAGPSEVIASVSAATRLQMLGSAGDLVTQSGDNLAVVGLYGLEQDGPLRRFLSEATVAVEAGDPSGVGVLVLVARSSADVLPIVKAIRSIVPLRTSEYTIDFSSDAGNIAQLVAGGRHRAARTSALAVAVSGAIIQGLVSAFGALTYRREIARSRALGATRFIIVTTLCLEAAIIVASGAVCGGVVAAVGVRQVSAGPAPVATLAALSLVFSVCVSILATLPVALAAAYRDPALVLRVP